MNYRAIASLFLLLPLLFGSSSAQEAAPEYSHPPVSSPSTGTITYGELPPPPPTPYTDVTVHGTMWQPEKRSQFSVWSPKGWATQARIKVAGYEWVHISVPIMSVMESRSQYVDNLEFCARSTNGAVSHPQHVDAYAGDTVFFSYNITWPADNSYRCFSMNIGHNWKADLGISVQLHFGNTTSSIYLYKAWARSSD